MNWRQIMKKIYYWLLGLLVLVGLGIYVGNTYQTYQKEISNESDFKVVATFYPVYEFTKAIVGNEGQVDLLIGAGTEIHGYQPSTKDLAKIQEAQVFVYADDNMETWISEVTGSIDKDQTAVIEATGDMLLMPGSEEEHDHDHGGEDHNHAYDPHVWTSPSRSIRLVENIRDQLISQYPQYESAFKKNADSYLEKLKTLDQKYQDNLSKAKQKSFITQHSAFSYLALDYGLDQVSIAGVSAETEPSAQRLSELSKLVKDNQIKYIYFEENASSKVAQTLAKEDGVKTAVLNPLEGLTKKQEEAGKDYIGIMEDNLEALLLTTESEGKSLAKEEEKTVAKGYFKDSQITDRALTDWSGEWQSVYPYLLDGTFDEVWDYKSKVSKGDMTQAEYKDYYTKGYVTDVETIKIDGDRHQMTFVEKGKNHTFTYKYVGYKVLTYEKGNRGVRYLFETDDPSAGQFKYVQFSDHIISSQKSGHYHIYFGGDSQEALLDELDNWPTYYPSQMTGLEIAQEMIAH